MIGSPPGQAKPLDGSWRECILRPGLSRDLFALLEACGHQLTFRGALRLAGESNCNRRPCWVIAQARPTKLSPDQIQRLSFPWWQRSESIMGSIDSLSESQMSCNGITAPAWHEPPCQGSSRGGATKAAATQRQPSAAPPAAAATRHERFRRDGMSLSAGHLPWSAAIEQQKPLEHGDA